MSLHPTSVETLREKLSRFFERLGRTSFQKSAEDLAREDREVKLVEKDNLGPCRTDKEAKDLPRFDYESRGGEHPLTDDELKSILYHLTPNEKLLWMEVRPARLGGAYPMISAECWACYPMCPVCGREHADDTRAEGAEPERLPLAAKSYWAKEFERLDEENRG